MKLGQELTGVGTAVRQVHFYHAISTRNETHAQVISSSRITLSRCSVRKKDSQLSCTM